ncbi:MAG: hypothetical protein EOP50_06810 [Sphingobacteriales bacterium]|nr:MAG: hypothetical protein EOP50_06810 [Sphingobacteriales bacterium]
MAPNNAFKPKLHRYASHMAERACHVSGYALQFGLTQALGLTSNFMSALSNKLAATVIFGCGLFFVAFVFAAHKIYAGFQGSGIPVWSGGKVIAVLDPLLTTLVAVALSAVVAGLIIWRTLRALRSPSHGSRK